MSATGSVDHFSVANVDAHVVCTAFKKEHEVAGLGILLGNLCNLCVLLARRTQDVDAGGFSVDVLRKAATIETVRSIGARNIRITDLLFSHLDDGGAQHFHLLDQRCALQDFHRAACLHRCYLLAGGVRNGEKFSLSVGCGRSINLRCGRCSSGGADDRHRSDQHGRSGTDIPQAWARRTRTQGRTHGAFVGHHADDRRTDLRHHEKVTVEYRTLARL